MPFHRGPPWNFRTQYSLVNWAISFLWLLRNASPAAWILSAFQVEDGEGRHHTAATPTEVYVLLVHAGIPLVLFFLPTTWVSYWAVTLIAVLLIVEICQYHVYLMVIRPVIDRGYTQYNFARTMLLTLISYQGLISLFAIVFLSRFSDQFSVPLDAISAWSLSAGILTGTGYSGISPKAGSMASFVGGIEALVGVLFLTTIIGLALSRVSVKSIDTVVQQGPYIVDSHQVRRALAKAGKVEAIDQIQEALQVDVWVVGGWLRSLALGQNDYEGDVDLLVSDLSHDDLATRLSAKSIRFSRSRLGGIKFSPLPGVKIDCFSTRAFGPAVSIQESFAYFNTTVNAAAFKFSNPDTFFMHPLFESDVTKRLLRILPNGLLQQSVHDRGRSLVGTLHLLTREQLSLVPDTSTRQLVKSLAKDPQFVYGCNFICNLLEQSRRPLEAEVIRSWLI
jgi:hypothetical protein